MLSLCLSHALSESLKWKLKPTEVELYLAYSEKYLLWAFCDEESGIVVEEPAGRLGQDGLLLDGLVVAYHLRQKSNGTVARKMQVNIF